MILKQIEEINKIRDSAQLVSKTLGLMAREIKPGVDSLYLDKILLIAVIGNKNENLIFSNVVFPINGIFPILTYA